MSGVAQINEAPRGPEILLGRFWADTLILKSHSVGTCRNRTLVGSGRECGKTDDY